MALDYRRFPILVVDDEPDILRSFELNYGDEFHIVTAEGGEEGLVLLEKHPVAVVVADQRMPRMDGTEFLRRSMQVRPDAVRIILTGYTDIDALVTAVNASQIYRYVTKPWDIEEMRMTLMRAIEVYDLAAENQRLVEELKTLNTRLSEENAYLREATVASSEIVGESPGIRNVLELVAKVAPSSTTVLIQGETGTGKELVARAIHQASPRRDHLFVAVNCAALSEGVLESELFGHKRGAFTGATSDRKGMFEVADGGTLFLDEISETSVGLQAKLLRVLQEGEIRPVGQTQALKVDVRVVAATNRTLKDEVAAGRFREDLYFRLNVFPVLIPPLRERREDIALLARHLTRRLSVQLKKRVEGPTPEAIALLERHDFPGNVRELANEIERAILLAEPGAPLTEDLFSDTIQRLVTSDGAAGLLQQRTDDFEREQIRQTLEQCGGVKTRAADVLGITYRGLLKKMKRLGMI
ncbi:MAG TPA: sigma-54 dependent transcriptional regulator [Candidatus Limnocylindria bacterium]|nr:sigma-54 dependent transcriptional regulator [Candidatus Limnocylindria bacterium]